MEEISSMPNLSFFVGIVGLFCFAVASYAVWSWLASNPKFEKNRLNASALAVDPLPHRLMRAVLIACLIVLVFTTYLTVGYDYFISHDQPEPWFIVPFKILAVLVIYDFVHYWLHRAMHLPLLMRYIHHVHHRVRQPTALDDLYISAGDALWVTAVLFLSIAIVGPLGEMSFLGSILAYAIINNTIHSGMQFKHPALKLLTFWSRHHYVHHAKNPRANYGIVFPIWDKMFGTAA